MQARTWSSSSKENGNEQSQAVSVFWLWRLGYHNSCELSLASQTIYDDMYVYMYLQYIIINTHTQIYIYICKSAGCALNVSS